jgi:uncharacterized protein (DUF58 family)
MSMADLVLRPAAPRPASQPSPEPPDESGWTPTRALRRAVLLTGLLLLAGVLLGRIDVVVLAVPFAVGTAAALRRRPAGTPAVGVGLAEPAVAEGRGVEAAVTVDNPDPVGYDVVVVRTRVSPWLRVAGAGRPSVFGVPPGNFGTRVLPGEALRWGRHPVGPAVAQVTACGGLIAHPAVVSGTRTVRVYPVTEPFSADEAMPRAAGLVGAHRSRRPGEGGELAGVRMFGPGDRLRRIDWRVSLRARHLHVSATLSDRDAEVVLLLDVLTEAGRSGGITGAASVLDTTVRAAAAIGEHYLHQGDRVSMLEYSPVPRRLRPAAGRRQYLTLLEWLLDVRVHPAPDEPYDNVFGPHLLSANALVVVLTPLIDPRSAAMLARLARAGRFVVAVDTLPAATSPGRRAGWRELAHRLWRLERENTIGQLREHGVPVVAWAGAGSLDQVLRDVSRLASGPKPVLR